MASIAFSTPTQRPTPQRSRLLWLILVLALALRVIFSLAQDPLAPYNNGNDSGWYLGNGYALITGKQPPGLVTDVSQLAEPPIYFILIGVPQALFSPAGAVIAVRVLQALLSVATCYFAYQLAVRLTDRESVGLLAAGVLAISPAFIINSSQILTETTYIFFMTFGIWLYVESVLRDRRGILPLLALAAILFGLATLTRAVFLAFPLGIAIHIILVRGWRKGWRQVAFFLLVYALTVSTWTIYSVARWNRFVVAGTGLDAFLYVGATGWQGPQQVDQRLEQQTNDPNVNDHKYLQAAVSTISADPIGWVKHRIEELANAYFQPEATAFFPGASLKDMVVSWLHSGHSISGLIALTQGPGFWPKLILYVFHYVGLIFGVIGMWLYRKRWQIALPMIGFVVYVTLVHLFVLALPRYVFPNEVFWWIFAAAALQRIYAALTRRRVLVPA